MHQLVVSLVTFPLNRAETGTLTKAHPVRAHPTIPHHPRLSRARSDACASRSPCERGLRRQAGAGLTGGQTDHGYGSILANPLFSGLELYANCRWLWKSRVLGSIFCERGKRSIGNEDHVFWPGSGISLDYCIGNKKWCSQSRGLDRMSC